jgi:sugar lactone lactonase YvrE
MKPNLIFHSNAQLLEGPRFDAKHNLLYFVSILDHLVYCYNPETQEILSMNLKSPASCLYIIDFKSIVVATQGGFYEVDFNTLESRFKFQIDIPEKVRYNDGIMDAKGRFLIGTMGHPEVVPNIGTVYSYHQDNYKVLIENTTISNGLAFSEDSKTMYFIDTPVKKVAKYRYDVETGDAHFEDYVISFDGRGEPDGMCMDPNGLLWIAEWGGSCVSVWDPMSGEKIKHLELPCKNVTSCCFDADHNLYVTTAKSGENDDFYGGGLYFFKLNKQQL